MNLINGKVLVEPIKENKNRFGIITETIPVVDEGIVVLSDPEISDFFPTGTKVRFKPNNGTKINYLGKECLVLIGASDDDRTDIIFKYNN